LNVLSLDPLLIFFILALLIEVDAVFLFLNLFLLLFKVKLLAELVVIYLDQNSYCAIVVCELKSIGQKVQKYLVVPALVSQNLLNQANVLLFIDLDL
jgi:hypothetical protein